MLNTPSGIVTLSRFKFPEKALELIIITDWPLNVDGMITSVSFPKYLTDKPFVPLTLAPFPMEQLPYSQSPLIVAHETEPIKGNVVSTTTKAKNNDKNLFI